MKHTRLVVRLTGLGEAQAEGVVAVLALLLLGLGWHSWRIGRDPRCNADPRSLSALALSRFSAQPCTKFVGAV